MLRDWRHAGSTEDNMEGTASSVPPPRHRQSGALHSPKLDFRTLLVLSIPGILTWFVLHGSLLAVLPDAYYGPDSNSCFDFARKLLTEGDLELAEKRRWLYPLLLAVFGVLPGSVLTWSAFFQHGLVLLTTPLAAAVGYHLSYRRSLAAMLLGVLWASGPRLVLYCHEVVADSLIPVVFLVAVAAVIFHLRGYRGGWITYAFLFAAIGALLKPHGRPIWLGIVLAIGLTAGWRLLLSRQSLLINIPTVILVMTAGSASQGGWLLLSSVLPIVDPIAGSHPEYRAALAPLIAKYSSEPDQYFDDQRIVKKLLNRRNPPPPIGEKWGEVTNEKKLMARVSRDLALEAIRRRPFEFGLLVFRSCGTSCPRSIRPINLMARSSPPGRGSGS
jgi:hypothetical protein